MSDQKTEQRIRLAVGVGGKFDIAAITAGEGNGWMFSGSVLEQSLSLWDGVSVFVDHQYWGARSVRDLGGVLHKPIWNADAGAIECSLWTQGPSAQVIEALGREWLAADTKSDVGFSADVAFTARENVVVEIVKVFSVDLVVDPARGGMFLRALNQNSVATKEKTMSDKKNEEAVTPTSPVAANELQDDLNAVKALLGAQKAQDAMQAEIDAVRQTRLQMCEHLLESGLLASKLPTKAQEKIRKQFAGKVFDAKELNTAIEDMRDVLGDAGAGSVVAGVARVSGMFNSRDQIQAAVDDLLGAPREEGAKSLKVARLSGIRELYLGLTGDLDFFGGVDLSRAQFQHTTSTFTGLVKNALNKSLREHWDQLGRAGYDWWKNVSTVEHFDSLNQITWMIFGTVGSLPSVSEGAEYTELKIGDSPETANFTKYGGYIGVTLEALDRDDTRKLRAIPRELANASLRNISSLVAAIFTDNSSVGPTLADTGALFNSTAVTTAGGHKNLLTTALGTDYTAWDAAASAMYNQPMLIANETGYIGTGKKMAIDPKFCLVPRALKAQAEALFIPRWAAPPTTAHPAGADTYGGWVTPVCVPEWTDATDWAAVADPALVPGIMIGERFGIQPEVFVAGDELSPAVFMNDESRIKVRHFVAVGVCDFRPLHKSNVAG